MNLSVVFYTVLQSMKAKERESLTIPSSLQHAIIPQHSYPFFPSPALFLYFHIPSSLLQLSFSTFISLLPFSSSLSLLSYPFFPSPALFLYFHISHILSRIFSLLVSLDSYLSYLSTQSEDRDNPNQVQILLSALAKSDIWELNREV